MCPWFSPIAAKRMRPPSARARLGNKELAVIPAAEAAVVLRKSRRLLFACDIVLTPLVKRRNCICGDFAALAVVEFGREFMIFEK
jgi:hypothetical protein